MATPRRGPPPEPREPVQLPHEQNFAKVNRRREAAVLFGGNCAPSRSYYFDQRGDTPGLRPVTGFEHWLTSRFFPLANYHFETR